MPSMKASSKEKIKSWFRNRSRSHGSTSAKSKGVLGASGSAIATKGNCTSDPADASSTSVNPLGETASSTVDDGSASSTTNLPTNVTLCVDEGFNKVDTANEKLDPWGQAMSFLNEDDRSLLKSIDDLGDQEAVFADLQRMVTEKQRISQEKAWKITFGGRRIVLRDVAAKITTWLSSFKDIGDLISQADPVHIGIPWSAIKVVLSILVADQEQMGLILIGMERVICLVTRCSVYQTLYLDHGVPTTKAQAMYMAQLSNSMARLYAKIFAFLAYYIRLLDLNTAAQILKSFYQPGRVSEMLMEIGTDGNRVESDANSCESAVVRPIFQRIDENSDRVRTRLRELMSRLYQEMLQLWKRLNEDERCRILQWVSDIPYESDHYNAHKGRVGGTGEWLICHEIFKTWRECEDSSILWLSGIPGSGKTKLSSKVVDNLSTGIPAESHDNIAIAYFYCDHNRADHNEPVAIIRSLVRQLCTSSHDNSIETCVEDCYLKRKAKGFASDRLVVEECKQLLFQLLQGYRKAYILVDGLDECNRATRHILMNLLDEVIGKFNQGVKIYIASRADRDLRQHYHEGLHLEATASDNQEDIERFVSDRMQQSEFCRTRLSQDLHSDILRTFREKSQGMFQWATLHIGELLELERNSDIKQYLDGLPKGLEAAYDNIYARISAQTGSKKTIAFAAFQILMASWRPLHPFELAIAVAQSPSHEFIIDQDIDVGYVLEVCHNLLVVTDGSQEGGVSANLGRHYGTGSGQDNGAHARTANWESSLGFTKESICKFAHLSVQEYLESKHWNSSEAHGFMLGICTRTLMCLRLPDEPGMAKGMTSFHYDAEGRNNDVTFRVSEVRPQKKLIKVVPDDGRDTKAVDTKCNDESHDTETAEPSFCPPPFECYVELADPHSHDDNESCVSQNYESFLEGHEGSPLESWVLYCVSGISLHLSAQRLTYESQPATGFTFQNLLEDFLGSPIQSTVAYQAWLRLAQSVWQLDEHVEDGGLSLSFRVLFRPYDKPALGCALLGAHEILDTWMSNGDLDPKECNAHGDSLLHLAALANNTETCRVLLQHGANPNTLGSFVRSPLDPAVRHQNVELVRILAEAEVSRGDSQESKVTAVRFGKLIERAVIRGGNVEIVEILLDAAQSASCDNRLPLFKESLFAAAYLCNTQVVALLLSHWGNAQDDEFQKMVHTALAYVPPTKSGINVMQTLANHIKNRAHSSLLHRAIVRKDWAFAQASILVGFDVNAPSEDQNLETPLHSLFREPWSDTLEKSRMLLDSGAKVNSQDSYGDTPLALAMGGFLYHHRTNDDNNTSADTVRPRNSSSKGSRLEALQELLERGANPNIVNDNGLTSLGIACVNATVTPQVIELLLDHGAAVNTTQGNGDITMSPLDILHLHDKPQSKGPRPHGDRLEMVKGILTRHGGRHLQLANYDSWDSQQKMDWIHDNRRGAFDRSKPSVCFAEYDNFALGFESQEHRVLPPWEVYVGPRWVTTGAFE